MSNRDASDAVAALDGENPVPASLVIKLDDPEQVESVANKLVDDSDFQSVCDDPDDVSASVLYGRETVERLFSVTYYIRIATIALVVLLTFVSFVFINNTIRLAISARRREIGIERLVGASNSFIRGPFVAEAALEALFGAVLAIVMLNVATNALLPRLSNALSFLSFDISQSVIISTYVLLIVVGVLLGLLGSAIAMRRYLKV
jgi:cell division transport system permease protein